MLCHKIHKDIYKVLGVVLYLLDRLGRLVLHYAPYPFWMGREGEMQNARTRESSSYGLEWILFLFFRRIFGLINVGMITPHAERKIGRRLRGEGMLLIIREIAIES